MSKSQFLDLCTASEECLLPDSPYRAMLTKLHSEMMEDINRLNRTNAALVEALEAVRTWGVSNRALDIPRGVRQKMEAALAKSTGETK
jgi:hypothetical protein